MNLRKLVSVFVFVFLFGLMPGIGFATVSAPLAWPGSTSGTDIDSGLHGIGFEPSGLFWNDVSNKLFGVGDGGQVVSMNADGSGVTTWAVSGDLEGITFVDESSSIVYLLNENGSIIKYDLSGSRTLQTWDTLAYLPEKDGWAGGEALAYMPISGTNYFVAGWQYDGTFFVFDLSGTTVNKVGSFKTGMGRTDLADMYYEDGLLYALYDSENVLEVLTVSKVGSSFVPTLVHEYIVPGADQEGFTLASSTEATRTAFIAQDSGGIISYTGFPNFSYTEPVVEPCTPTTWYLDADGDALGTPNSTQSACEQPVGYVSNNVDTYDNIPNYGVEIPEDRVDNNMNGTVDEINVGYNHPYYSTVDPTTNRRAKIWSMWGSRNGDYGVRYGDMSIFRFSAFDVNTKNLTSVYPILNTGYALVVYGDNVAIVNAFAGTNVVTTTLTALSGMTIDEIKVWAQTELGL
ncbi:MAG: hypothetical protein WC897_04670 [Candidatus Gracilibacteria bacterium]